METVEWQGKWELSQRSLLELSDEYRKEQTKSELAQKQVDILTGLCRALQDQSKQNTNCQSKVEMTTGNGEQTTSTISNITKESSNLDNFNLPNGGGGMSLFGVFFIFILILVHSDLLKMVFIKSITFIHF